MSRNSLRATGLVFGIVFILANTLLPLAKVYAANTDPYFKVFGGDVMSGGWFNAKEPINVADPLSGQAINCTTTTTKLPLASFYQDPNYKPADANNDWFGGVLTKAVIKAATPDISGGPHNYNVVGGASSQYGAFAAGAVKSALTTDGSGINGFYSSGASIANNPPASPSNGSLLTFGGYFKNNQSLGSIKAFGGYSQGGYSSTSNPTLYSSSISRQPETCIPDYYNLKLPTATPPKVLYEDGKAPVGSTATFSKANVDSGAISGVYKTTGQSGPTFNLSPGGATSGIQDIHIPAGRNITIFYDADEGYSNGVYINQNIIYDLDRADNVPKFELIVRGNIYIDPKVTRLDGIFIAQPRPSKIVNGQDPIGSMEGDIWTCTDESLLTIPDRDRVHANCGMPLTINGALVANEVQFLRWRGNVDSPVANEDDFGTTLGNCPGGYYKPALSKFVVPGTCNIAEVINYTPATVFGPPLLNATTASSDLKIESIESLPPVF